MREDYIFADREVAGSYGLRAQSEREPPICTQVLIDRQVGEGVPKDRYGWQIEELEARLTRRKARSRPLSRPGSPAPGKWVTPSIRLAKSHGFAAENSCCLLRNPAARGWENKCRMSGSGVQFRGRARRAAVLSVVCRYRTRCLRPHVKAVAASPGDPSGHVVRSPGQPPCRGLVETCRRLRLKGGGAGARHAVSAVPLGASGVAGGVVVAVPGGWARVAAACSLARKEPSSAMVLISGAGKTTVVFLS